MREQRAWVLCLAFLPSYSYCEPFTYGATGNAASAALQWSMPSVLPPETGLSVNGVIYRYKANKNTDDDMVVSVQNENALGAGYIFREVDDWSGLPSNTITKAIPVDNIPLAYWGDGEIAVDGDGSVSEASVIYTYRIDECFNPQSSPTCEGYIEPMTIEELELEVYNALEDEAVLSALEKTDQSLLDDEQEETEEEKERKSRLELGLTASENALTLAAAGSQQSMLEAMNSQTDINMYYNAQLRGGVYPDAPMIDDAKIPDNKRGLRNNLAQQVLHEKMVQSQYD